MQSALGFNNDATGSLTKQQAVTQNNSHTLPKLYIKIKYTPQGQPNKIRQKKIFVLAKESSKWNLQKQIVG